MHPSLCTIHAMRTHLLIPDLTFSRLQTGAGFCGPFQSLFLSCPTPPLATPHPSQARRGWPRPQKPYYYYFPNTAFPCLTNHHLHHTTPHHRRPCLTIKLIRPVLPQSSEYHRPWLTPKSTPPYPLYICSPVSSSFPNNKPGVLRNYLLPTTRCITIFPHKFNLLKQFYLLNWFRSITYTNNMHTFQCSGPWLQRHPSLHCLDTE